MAASLRRTLSRWAVVLGLLLVLWPAPLASAQAGLSLTALTIELWPEYDQPSMLVILRGTLASTVALPATVTLHLPAAVGGPSAVAGQDPAGQLFNIPFTTTTTGATIAVQFEVPLASFQVEYYDPGLTRLGNVRDYAFHWQADFSAEAATLRVQEPLEAGDLSAEPPVTLAGSSDLGVNYYTTALGAIRIGQTVSVHLRYTKATSALTTDNLNQPSVAPLPSEASQTTASWTPSPQVLIGGGLGLVGAGLVGWGVVWLVRDRSGGLRRPRTRRSAPRLFASPALGGGLENTPNFCTQCGQSLETADRFCRHCGAPIRSTITE